MGSNESHVKKNDSLKTASREGVSVRVVKSDNIRRVSDGGKLDSRVENPLLGSALVSLGRRSILENQNKFPNGGNENLISLTNSDGIFDIGNPLATSKNSAWQSAEAGGKAIIKTEEEPHKNDLSAPQCASGRQPPMKLENIKPNANRNIPEVINQPQNREVGDYRNKHDRTSECDILEVETPSDAESWSSLSNDDASPTVRGDAGVSDLVLNNVSKPHFSPLHARSGDHNNTLPRNNDVTDDDDVLTQDGCHIDAVQSSSKLIHSIPTTISNVDSVDSSNVHCLVRFPSQKVQCFLCSSPTVLCRSQQVNDVNLCKDCAVDNINNKKRLGFNPGMMSLVEPHANSSGRWNGETSASTSNTEATSNLLYDPCSVCNRTIDDAENVHRCSECDFIVCPDCYGSGKIDHGHELRSFRRTTKSSIQELTPLSNWSRKSGGNRIINNYVIICHLGQGSFAKVKLVQNVQTGKLFALKILRRPKAVSLLNRVKSHSNDDNLLREVAVMKYIEHPNIVKLIEVIEDVEGGGRLYLIMEYCQRGPVHRLGRPPLSLAEVRDFGCGILRGLLYLHAEFLYHRDIKPANCLVTDSGVVKLVDFGTCNSRRCPSGMDGTPAFNCPEMVQGDNAAGEIADSWAFALTLYQMATGTLPCEGMSAPGYRSFLRSVDPIPIPSPGEGNSIDVSLHHLLSQMLKKDLEERMLLSKAVWHPFFQFTKDEINSMLRKRYNDEPITDGSCGASEGQTHQTLCSSHNPCRVSHLYDKALMSVKCGRNLPEAFHGIKDINLMHRMDLQAAEEIGSSLPSGLSKNSHLSRSLSCSSSKVDKADEPIEPALSIDSEPILGIIATQKREKSQALELANIQMVSLPTFVNDVASLTTKMRLVSNCLRRLTNVDFSSFTHLKEVSIICNHLEHFPEEVLKAPCLVRLDLSHNRITEIPPLKSAGLLEHLGLHSNNITTVGLDPATGQSVLTARSLKLVRLSSNPILSLPMGLESLRRLSLVLDAHPDLCAQWAKIVEEQNRSRVPPNLLFIIWDEYFPARVSGTDLPIWIASSNLGLYRFQTLQVCNCKHVVMFSSANSWFPIGRVTGEKLAKHFREIEFFQHNARKNREVSDGRIGTEPSLTGTPSVQLPPIVRFKTIRYVKEYFFISEDEEDRAGGYYSLLNFISDTLEKKEPIMFFMMCSHPNLQHTREIAVAALSEYLMTVTGHGTLKDHFDAVIACMRNLI